MKAKSGYHRNDAERVRAKRLKSEFVERIHPATPFLELFSYLPDVHFFMKDRQGRFMAANPLQVEKLGCGTEEDVIGLNDYDFFPAYHVFGYIEDDRNVMRSGRPMAKKVEIVANQDGTMDWHVTTKLPARSADGETIGVVGIMRDLDREASMQQPYREMGKVIDFIARAFDQRIEVGILARLIGLSTSQFERRFRELFHLTPTGFITRFRVTRACKMLVDTNYTIARVAVDTGFYDHAHFSRAFSRIMGLSPTEYRKKHR